MKRNYTLLILIVLWSFPKIQAQSVYTDRQDFSVQLAGGLIRASQDVSGSTIGAGISIRRNLDLFFTTSDFGDKPGYYAPYRVSSGGLGFYPLKQWEDQPFTVQVTFSGSKATMVGNRGWSFLTGTTATWELKLNQSYSFYPAASFMYAPFTNNRGDGSSLIGVDGTFCYDIANILKLFTSPTIVKPLDGKPTTFGFSLGLVL